MLVNLYFFCITHKSSLKVSFQELRTHFFFLLLLFSTVFGEEAENEPLGHTLSRWTWPFPDVIFTFFWQFFFQATHEFNASDLKPFNEFRRRLNEQDSMPSFKITLLFGFSLFLLGMSSCWKKPVSCFDWNRIYALTEYQIRHWKVKVSFAVIFRLKASIQSRQMRDEISCDRKYVL